MCFSSSASFIAGASLLAVGAGSLKYAKKPHQYFFAAIPLLFAVQQTLEGFLWLSFLNNDFLAFKIPSMYGFLLFAQVIWPTWVPLSIWRLENKKRKKKIQAILLAIGIAISLYLAFCLLIFEVDAEILQGNIQYTLKFPHTDYYLLSIMYFLTVAISPFFSSLKYMKVLGILVILSLIITTLFFNNHLISVWCFFAAAISVMVLFIMRRLGKGKS